MGYSWDDYRPGQGWGPNNFDPHESEPPDDYWGDETIEEEEE